MTEWGMIDMIDSTFFVLAASAIRHCLGALKAGQ
jgi:hypothetical protein